MDNNSPHHPTTYSYKQFTYSRRNSSLQFEPLVAELMCSTVFLLLSHSLLQPDPEPILDIYPRRTVSRPRPPPESNHMPSLRTCPRRDRISR
eukprot:176190-Hanusia_phi.AAC.1